jgi:hypothetical protein
MQMGRIARDHPSVVCRQLGKRVNPSPGSLLTTASARQVCGRSRLRRLTICFCEKFLVRDDLLDISVDDPRYHATAEARERNKNIESPDLADSFKRAFPLFGSSLICSELEDYTCWDGFMH